MVCRGVARRGGTLPLQRVSVQDTIPRRATTPYTLSEGVVPRSAGDVQEALNSHPGRLAVSHPLTALRREGVLRSDTGTPGVIELYHNQGPRAHLVP